MEGNYPGSQLEPWELPGSSLNSSRIENRSACSPSELFFMAAMCFARKRRWCEYADAARLVVAWDGGGKTSAILLHCSSALPCEEEETTLGRNTQLESARFKCAGSVLDPAMLAMTWHGGVKTGGVLPHCDSALPARKKQKKKHVGGKKTTPVAGVCPA